MTQQAVKETEQKVETDEESGKTPEQLAAEGFEEASKEEEPVPGEETEDSTEEVEETEGETEEVITFKSQTELDEHVKKRIAPEANRIANKSTAPIQTENNSLKSENARLKRDLEYKAEDSKLGKLEAAELEESGDTEDVRKVQDVRREVIKQGRDIKQREQVVIDKEDSLNKTGLRQDAFEKALKLFLPEDEEFLSTIESFAKKLEEATTQKEMDLIFSMEESKIKAKAEAEPKPKRKRPDSNLPSAPGGKNTKDMTGSELLEQGFKDLVKKNK